MHVWKISLRNDSVLYLLISYCFLLCKWRWVFFSFSFLSFIFPLLFSSQATTTWTESKACLGLAMTHFEFLGLCLTWFLKSIILSPFLSLSFSLSLSLSLSLFLSLSLSLSLSVNDFFLLLGWFVLPSKKLFISLQNHQI